MSDNEVTMEINWDQDTDRIDRPVKKVYTCGEYQRKIDPHTGKVTWTRWYCRKYHTCPHCKGMKQKALTEKLTPFVNDPNIRVIPHSDDIKDYNDTYAERMHIPRGDGSYYTVVRSTDSSVGEPLTKEMLSEISNYAVAPQGKRISGNLGKQASIPGGNKQQDDDFPEEVKRRVFKYVDEDEKNFEEKKVISQIEKELDKETADLDPKNALQVQDAIYVKEQKLIEIAKRYNVEILFLYTETIIVYANRIQWKEDKISAHDNASPPE